MRHMTAKRIAWGIAAVGTLGSAPGLQAQIGVGTWTRTDAAGIGLSMTVTVCCSGGRRLVYHVKGPNGSTIILTVDSPMDGTEVPALVGGKPSGETMAIKRVDDHHYTGVVKMDGQPFGTSKGVLSADGRTLTVESTPAGPNQKTQIETWVLK
jgi:hypothetical protein